MSTAAATPITSTSERLLEAAEDLIATRGLEAVSVRAVNAAAGANVAAVHYHFGSKEALVDAVLDRRMGELTERRMMLLRPLADVARPSVHAVVEALVLPLAEFAADPDGPGRTYVQFLSVLHAAGDAWRTRMGDAFAPQYAHVESALQRALPDVPPPVVAFRLALVSAAMLGTLADPDHAARHWNRVGVDITYDALVAALIDDITGALAARVTPQSTGGLV